MHLIKENQRELLVWLSIVSVFTLLTVYSANYDSIRKSPDQKSGGKTYCIRCR